MAVPGVRRVAILVDDSNPVNVEEARQVQAAADELGVKSATLGIRRAEDIVPAFEGLKDRADALYVVANPLVLSNIIRINILAVGARLPTSYIAREYARPHASVESTSREAGSWPTDRASPTSTGVPNPGTIPVEQPTKFDLVINLTTAKASRAESCRRNRRASRP